MTNEIGIKIKKIRQDLNITQEEMGVYLGVTQSNYGRLEKDDSRLNIPKLKIICKCLGISIITLLK